MVAFFASVLSVQEPGLPLHTMSALSVAVIVPSARVLTSIVEEVEKSPLIEIGVVPMLPSVPIWYAG